MNQRIAGALKQEGVDITGIYYCPHHDDDRCACRKPQTGLLTRAARDHGLDLSRSWLIGDSTRDMQTAGNIKKRYPTFRCIGVLTGQQLADGRFPARPDFTAHHLLEAARIIQKETGSRSG